MLKQRVRGRSPALTTAAEAFCSIPPQENLPALRVILCAMGETARSFIGAFLPQLALKVFMALLPTICTRMAWLRGARRPRAPQCRRGHTTVCSLPRLSPSAC